MGRADLRIRSLKGERGLRFNRLFFKDISIKLDTANAGNYLLLLLFFGLVICPGDAKRVVPFDTTINQMNFPSRV